MELKEIKVHLIVDGPYHSSDVTDDFDGDYEGDFFFCEALVEDDGEMSQEELRFDDYDDFYAMQAHLSKSIEPYVIDMGIEE
jgi:hypothetical protein